VTAEEIVRALGLAPHPEGGFFRETFRAEPLPFELPGRGPRSASTSIYFLLAGDDFSAFHRVRSDEVWHHYLGAPLDEFASHRKAHEGGLHVRVSQPPRRIEAVVDDHRRRISTRLFAAAALFHSPAVSVDATSG